jgi:hypothetical protein
MAPPPFRHETQPEPDHRLSFVRTYAIVTIVTTAIKYGALVACVGFVYLSISALAGKMTLASVGIRLLGNLKVSDGICGILTGGGILYGVGQRQLRRRAVKRLANEKNDMERILDLQRSSSGLTSTGETRPEDET